MKQSLDNLALPAPSATIVDRLRYLIKLSRLTQARFAERVGVDPSNISRMLSGHNPVNEAFVNRVVVDLGVSKPWLVDGVGVPFPRDIHARTLEGGGSVVASHDERRGAPVYDINVSAGSANLSREFTDDRIVGFCQLPGLNPAYPLVRVRGNSMSPRLQDGSWVSIRPVSDTAPILWGQIYVVVLDDYRMIKYVRRHPDPSMIILHSDNPDYDDIEVPRSDVRDLFLVENILNFEIAI
ncbi:MAG: LexA family transcriptional regulator [Bacteroides sp.]|nr:LexA family transcriptional regulator [Bacteroides sp.]MDE6042529.1 XRE family transcriptional regulator [Muribaculaceae bacterium]